MAWRVMTWRIEFARGAAKELDKLDPPVSRRILAFLNERVGRLDDPRMLGEALKGSRLGELWKYRVGDYRVICALDDGVLKILVVRVGNRREVYR
jgi:mRNA interferase RelE/StbE